MGCRFRLIRCIRSAPGPTRRTAAAQNVCEEQQWVEGDGDKTVFKKLWPVSFF